MITGGVGVAKCLQIREHGAVPANPVDEFLAHFEDSCLAFDRSASAVTRRIGIGRANASHWKTRKRLPSLHTMRKIAREFGWPDSLWHPWYPAIYGAEGADSVQPNLSPTSGLRHTTGARSGSGEQEGMAMLSASRENAAYVGLCSNIRHLLTPDEAIAIQHDLLPWVTAWVAARRAGRNSREKGSQR